MSTYAVAKAGGSQMNVAKHSVAPNGSAGRLQNVCRVQPKCRGCRTSKVCYAAGVAHDASAASTTRDWFFTNRLGLKLEVKSTELEDASKPILLFIHGAGHGAWCWQVLAFMQGASKFHFEIPLPACRFKRYRQEKFMPYFQQKGYSSHALSLRGQGQSESAPGSKSGGSLDDHAGDISFFIDTVIKEPPILVGHSFGGLITETYVLRDYGSKQPVKGVALLAAAPPQGSDAMMSRFLRRRPIQSLLLTWSFVTKSYLKTAAGARRLFFSSSLPESQVERYVKLLRDNKSKLPAVEVDKIKESMPLPACNSQTPPALVIGGARDYMVDLEGLVETAAHFQTKAIVLPGLAHDLMLDTQWEDVAAELDKWIAQMPAEGINS